jgi:phospholipid/cholesterol/gamma-HCH transport system permease protein
MDHQLTIGRDADGTVVVGLQGRFRMDEGLVSADALDRALEEVPRPRQVRFDAGALTEWDSTLVAVLAAVVASCKRRSVEVNPSGVPTGARRLLGLVESAPAAPVGPTPERPSWTARIGLRALALARRSAQLLDFVGRTTFSLGRLFLGRARCRPTDILREMTSASAGALPIVSVVSGLLGVILAFVGSVTLSAFGAAIYVADVVAVGMVRELGAVVTAVVMAGRTGSAYASEISTMNVTQETDALVTLGIDAIDFLVLPRMLALVVMMPLLYLYANAVAMIAGGGVAVGLLGLTPEIYIHQSRAALPLYVVGFGLVKSAAFGVIVALAGCMEGMRSGRSAADVGRAATNAVVQSIIWVIAADGVAAVLLYGLGL